MSDDRASKIHIGDVAALFDVTTKTLRHYEKLGLLEPEREENGYRFYGPEDVLRVQRIRQLQSLGLTLKEVARLLGRDDEMLWENVLRSLREEAAEEVALLQERLEWIEQLLDEGLPPDEERLPAPPGKVNEYLERHLPQGERQTWRHDRQVYASLQSVLSVGRTQVGRFALQRPGELQVGRFALQRPGELQAGGFAFHANGDGEREILRAVQKYGRVIERLEDEK